MKRIILSASLLALSASAAWAQGTTTAPLRQPHGACSGADVPAHRAGYGACSGADVPAHSAGYGANVPSTSPQRDVPPYTAEVGPRKGDWEAFIGGSGASTNEFDNNALGVNGSIGYYVLKWLPLSLRQSFAANFGGDVNDNFQYSTTGAIDLQAPLGRFQPFIGGFGGYGYGSRLFVGDRSGGGDQVLRQ